MPARAHLLFGAALLVAGLAACGPVPVHQAERNCLDDARAAARPQGHAVIGVGSDGGSVRPMGRIEMSISSDYVLGSDPADVFNRCVMRQSGQMPTRPLQDQPGWRG